MKKTKNVKNKKIVKKKKIRFGRVFLLLVFLCLVFILIKIWWELPITSVVVKNNKYLTDQEIIDLLGFDKYPAYLKTTTKECNKKIGQNKLIEKIKITHRPYRAILVEVYENIPLYYDEAQGKTILKDKTKVDDYYQVPLLINYVPDTISDKLLKALTEVDIEIKEKITTIKYDPNDVDEERFLLTMTDGNLVYLTLEKFLKVNHYNEIMERVLVKYKDKKGVLYLDEGEYFVLENS